MNILVIRVGNMGDVLMATPFLRKVRGFFPGSHVDFVTSPQARPMVAHNPHIRKIFIYKKSKGFAGTLKRFFLIQHLRQRHYDICFVLEQHPQYKEFASQLRVKTKVGFSGEGEQWLERKMEFSYDRHVIDNYLRFLKEFWSAIITKDDLLMDLVLPPIPARLDQEIQGFGQYVIIHPGTTEYLPYRSWTPEGFAGLIGFWQQKGFAILITGQKAHQALIDQILNLCSEEQRRKVTCLLDKDLEELMHLIKNAQALIASDTGVMHMARALQVRVVGLFGPSNPYHTGPVGPGMYGFIRNDFKCGPCNYAPAYRWEDKKYCLDGKIPACMKSITLEQVTEACNKMGKG